MDSVLPIRAQIKRASLELVLGDITGQDVDAIVNAANSSLLGGGGVDGAIHRTAGPQLLEECRKLNGCPTGDARITGGYKLKARHVIHAVGPVYGSADAPELLASAHRRSLELATEKGLRSIAFPAISTGVYGYPPAEAAPIALGTVCDFLEGDESIQLVRFVLFTADVGSAFANALDRLVKSRESLSYL